MFHGVDEKIGDCTKSPKKCFKIEPPPFSTLFFPLCAPWNDQPLQSATNARSMLLILDFIRSASCRERRRSGPSSRATLTRSPRGWAARRHACSTGAPNRTHSRVGDEQTQRNLETIPHMYSFKLSLSSSCNPSVTIYRPQRGQVLCRSGLRWEPDWTCGKTTTFPATELLEVEDFPKFL